MQQRQRPESLRLPEGMKQLFVSYHFISMERDEKGMQKNGFGNIVLAINPEMYQNNVGMLIQDLQKQISITIENNLGIKEPEVQVLFYR